MNRTALSIRMLILLRSRGKMKKKDIAGALETNPRNITEFKKELEAAGYFIDYQNGPHGGYYMKDRGMIPVAGLSDKEQAALRRLSEYSRLEKDFLLHRDLVTALEKIMVVQRLEEEETTIRQVYKKFPLAKDRQELQDIYEKVHSGVVNRQEILIEYHSVNAGGTKKRIIHPYELFYYGEAWYVIGLDKDQDTVKNFKLPRILYIENLDEKFTVREDFDITDYLSVFGMEIKDQKRRVKLRIFPPLTTIMMERILGEDQIVTPGEDYVDIEVTITGDYILKELILGMGSKCQVLAPTALKQSIQEELKKACEAYQPLE
ncbi:MAG: hypothetical protein AVO33_06040 [delta proteobacterium ML8_F1]|nr:MAG: hypothetical protein AVO33_06040 [delta proteobacterium ML8_F1]